MGYTSQAVASLLLTLALVWIAVANFAELPGWLIFAAGVAAALTLAAAVRSLQKRRYYEGPRVAVIVDPRIGSPAHGMSRRRERHASHK